MSPAPPVSVNSSARTGGGNLSYWRERIVRALLVSICVLGMVAYVPSVWLALADDLLSIVVIDTLAYGWIVFVTVWPGASYALRAGSVAGVAYLLGVVLIVEVGMPSAGLFWLSTGPVVLALLAGLRAAVAGLLVMTLTVIALGVGIAMGVFAYAPPVVFPDGGLRAFLVGATNATLLSTAMSISGAMLLRGLEQSNAALALALEERRRLEAQLIDAHRLEAVGRLAGGIAHDFNNLLVPILTNAENLRRSWPSDNASTRALDDIVVSAERGRSLVERVLAFSGRRPTTRTRVRLTDVLHEAARLLRAALPAHIEIAVHVQGPDVTILADPVELHQVVMNLGANAGYAMQQRGGTLTLALDEGTDGMATLRVTDTGDGMPPDVLARALEPFFTTKPQGEGSGIGLATVRAIVDGLGGRLDLTSEVGRGTTVSVGLPIEAPAPDEVASPTPVAAQTPTPGPIASGPPRRALIVDDEELVLRSCAVALQRLGYEVVTMRLAREARSYLEDHAATLDVLITDRMMPDMDGLALAGIARAIDPTLPVVLVSGLLDEETKQRALDAGVVHVLSKPFRAAELAEAVRIAATHAEAAERPRSRQRLDAGRGQNE